MFPVKQEIYRAAFKFLPVFEFGLIFFFPALLVQGKHTPLPAIRRRPEDDVQAGFKSGFGHFPGYFIIPYLIPPQADFRGVGGIRRGGGIIFVDLCFPPE